MNSNWWPSTKKEYGNDKLSFVTYQLHILKDTFKKIYKKWVFPLVSLISSESKLVQHAILCFAPAAAVFTITISVTVLYPAKEYGFENSGTWITIGLNFANANHIQAWGNWELSTASKTSIGRIWCVRPFVEQSAFCFLCLCVFTPSFGFGYK